MACLPLVLKVLAGSSRLNSIRLPVRKAPTLSALSPPPLAHAAAAPHPSLPPLPASSSPSDVPLSLAHEQ